MFNKLKFLVFIFSFIAPLLNGGISPPSVDLIDYYINENFDTHFFYESTISSIAAENLDSAVASLEKLVFVPTKDPKIFAILLKVYEQKNDTTAILDLYPILFSSNPLNIDNYLNFAAFLNNHGKKKAALKIYESLIKYKPQDPDILLAIRDYFTSEFKNSKINISQFHHILKNQSFDDPRAKETINYILGTLYQSKGKKAKAQRHYMQCTHFYKDISKRQLKNLNSPPRTLSDTEFITSNPVFFSTTYHRRIPFSFLQAQKKYALYTITGDIDYAKSTYFYYKKLLRDNYLPITERFSYALLFARAFPHNTAPYKYLGYILMDMQNVERAIKVLNFALRKPPLFASPNKERAQIYNLLGIAYKKSGDTQAAETNFKKSIQEDPDLAAPYYNLAYIYRQSNQYKSVAKLLDKAFTLNYEEATINDKANYLYALLKTKRFEKFQEMTEAFRKDFYLDPWYHLTISRYYDFKNDPYRLFEELNLALLTAPKRYPEYLSQAIATLHKFDTAIDSSFNTPYFQQIRDAFRFRNAEQFDSAALYFEKALAETDAIPLIHIYLGECYYHTQKYDSALKQFLIAQNQMPDFPPVYWNLARAYEAIGDNYSAYENYKHAIMLDKDKNFWTTERCKSGIQKLVNLYVKNNEKLKTQIQHITKILEAYAFYTSSGKSGKIYTAATYISPSYLCEIKYSSYGPFIQLKLYNIQDIDTYTIYVDNRGNYFNLDYQRLVFTLKDQNLDGLLPYDDFDRIKIFKTFSDSFSYPDSYVNFYFKNISGKSRSYSHENPLLCTIVTKLRPKGSSGKVYHLDTGTLIFFQQQYEDIIEQIVDNFENNKNFVFSVPYKIAEENDIDTDLIPYLKKIHNFVINRGAGPYMPYATYTLGLRLEKDRAVKISVKQKTGTMDITVYNIAGIEDLYFRFSEDTILLKGFVTVAPLKRRIYGIYDINGDGLNDETDDALTMYPDVLKYDALKKWEKIAFEQLMNTPLHIRKSKYIDRIKIYTNDSSSRPNATAEQKEFAREVYKDVLQKISDFIDRHSATSKKIIPPLETALATRRPFYVVYDKYKSNTTEYKAVKYKGSDIDYDILPNITSLVDSVQKYGAGPFVPYNLRVFGIEYKKDHLAFIEVKSADQHKSISMELYYIKDLTADDLKIKKTKSGKIFYFIDKKRLFASITDIAADGLNNEPADLLTFHPSVLIFSGLDKDIEALISELLNTPLFRKQKEDIPIWSNGRGKWSIEKFGGANATEDQKQKARQFYKKLLNEICEKLKETKLKPNIILYLEKEEGGNIPFIKETKTKPKKPKIKSDTSPIVLDYENRIKEFLKNYGFNFGRRKQFYLFVVELPGNLLASIKYNNISQSIFINIHNIYGIDRSSLRIEKTPIYYDSLTGRLIKDYGVNLPLDRRILFIFDHHGDGFNTAAWDEIIFYPDVLKYRGTPEEFTEKIEELSNSELYYNPPWNVPKIVITIGDRDPETIKRTGGINATKKQKQYAIKIYERFIEQIWNQLDGFVPERNQYFLFLPSSIMSI